MAYTVTALSGGSEQAAGDGDGFQSAAGDAIPANALVSPSVVGVVSVTAVEQLSSVRQLNLTTFAR